MYLTFAFLLTFVAVGFSKCPEGQGLSPFFGQCETCRPGYELVDNSCIPCESGFFKPNEGAGRCQACPPNAISKFASSECTVCGPGFRKAPFVYGECEECERGFFKPNAGPGDCQPCPPNTSSSYGAAKCTSCPEGEVLLGNGVCGKCPAGSYYDDRGYCSFCPPGTFTCRPNNFTQCYKCGENSYAAQNSTGCITCKPGQVYLRTSGKCDVCPKGFYFDENLLECFACRWNLFSSGGTQRTCQRCKRGTYARVASDKCFKCPAGTFYIERSGRCEKCEDGRTYSRYRAECVFARNSGLSSLVDDYEY